MQRGDAQPASSLRLDWIMAALAVILMAGVIQDGWAHSHGLVDQSFLTPWHAILYGTMALNGVVLAAMAGVNVRRGWRLRSALPFGYGTSLLGVIVFAVGGAFDLYWHTRYGIETDINALISPSHLWLALGGAMVFAGPMFSIAHRYGRQTGGWRIAGPAILGAAAMLTLLGFFTQYAQPLGDAEVPAVIGPHQPETGGVLYAVRADGTNERRLAMMSQADIWGASASPDGKRVAFRVARGSSSASFIYVANIDGSRARRITNSGRHDTQPAWSPDGKNIAFVSMPAGTSGDFELRTIPANGGAQRVIASQTTILQFPAWSPDGKLIAYQTRNGLRTQIAVVSIKGGTSSFLQRTAGGVQPAWSARNAIAFVTDDGAIAATGPRGATLRQIVSGTPHAAAFPAWSADGQKIAFVRDGGGYAQVFVADLSTGRVTDASQLAGLNASRPAWTPRGDIVFTATGRANPASTFIGLAYSEDANIIEAIVITGMVLLLLRRWRMPFGAITLLLTLFAVSMAFQSDLFYEIPAALIAGLFADAAIALLGERARGGLGLYAIGFALPALMFTLYLAGIKIATGFGWPPNMIAGSSLIAGFAGLLVAFCFETPLRETHAA